MAIINRRDMSISWNLIGKLDVLRVSWENVAPQGLQPMSPLGLPLGRSPQAQLCPRGGSTQLDLGPASSLAVPSTWRSQRNRCAFV